MPSRGSGLATAVASTTFSPMRTTAEPWACLANFPVSNESFLPPARSTVISVTSGFMIRPYQVRKEGNNVLWVRGGQQRRDLSGAILVAESLNFVERLAAR